jgi:membrane fusion protein
MSSSDVTALPGTIRDLRKEGFGRPIRLTGSGRNTLIALVIFALASLAALGAVSSLSHIVPASGEIAPPEGAISLVVLKAGIVSRVQVRQGQVVKVGAPVVTLSVDTQLADGGLAAALTRAATAQESAQLDEAHAKGASVEQQILQTRERQAGLEAAKNDLIEEHKLQAEQVALAAKAIDSLTPVVAQGYVAQLQFQQYQNTLLQAQLAVKSTDEKLASNASDLRQADRELQRYAADRAAAEAQGRDAIGQIAEKRAGIEANRALVVTADSAGVVGAIRVHPGDTVTAGSEVAVIVPTASSLIAEVWLPPETAGLVRPGDQVKLRYQGMAQDELGITEGEVISRSSAPLANPSMKSGGSGADPKADAGAGGQYLVRVKLRQHHWRAHGRDWQLLPGMKVTAKIVVERRNLLSSVFRSVTHQFDSV